MIKLKAGDSVAIIAPAACQRFGTEWMVDKAVNILQGWGLNVQLYYSSQKRHFYLAGDDAYRKKNLLFSLNDPDIRGIFVTRGGYGSPRLLPFINAAIVCRPKIFCGFSDISALMFALNIELPQIECIHGPTLASPAFVDDSESGGINRQRLHRVLFDQNNGYQQHVEVIRPGNTSGPMVGGCLSVLISLLGTRFEPDFNQKILFLEDVDEKPFRIDRMLTQLSQAGKLQNVKGIVFGDMPDCEDSANPLQSVIKDTLRHYDFPIVYGFNAGHGAVNTAFRFDQETSIDCNKQLISLQ